MSDDLFSNFLGDDDEINNNEINLKQIKKRKRDNNNVIEDEIKNNKKHKKDEYNIYL